MASISILLTNLTSKFGILSKKACIRIATETGCKLVDATKQIGRPLNVKEVESVFSEILPKKCCPQIINKTDDVINIWKNNGYKDADIQKFLDMHFGAGVIPNKTKKMPIWLPHDRWNGYEDTIKDYLYLNQSSIVAHELEHALEKNCKLIEILRRKMSVVKGKFLSFIDKNSKNRYTERELRIHRYEENMQEVLVPCLNQDENLAIKCNPLTEEMAKELNISKEDFIDILRSYIRKNYASGENQGAGTFLRLKFMEYLMKTEKPAYKVQGIVEEYAKGFEKGKYSIYTGVSEMYNETVHILKAERRLYIKNRLFGHLKKPNVYYKDKDILHYAKTKEDKSILKEILNELNNEQKQNLIKGLYKAEENSNNIKNMKLFLDATKDMPDGGYKNYLGSIVGIEPKWLNNPDFMKIAKIQGSEGPAYSEFLSELTKLSEEQLNKFARIADIKGVDGYCKYQNLYNVIDSPDLDLFKAFADIEINGEYPYAGAANWSMAKFSSHNIKIFLKMAKDYAMKGENIAYELENEAYKILG